MAGLSKNPAEDCFNPCVELLARISKWLKDTLIVLEAQAGGSAKRTPNYMNNHSLARSGDGLMIGSKEEPQAPIEGEESFATAGEGKVVCVPACRCLPSAKSLLPKTLLNPAISGLEALNGHMESKGDGCSSLCVCRELQEIKRLLTTLRGDVESGIERVEEVICSLAGA